MGLKKIITNLLPAYRAKNAVIDELEGLYDSIESLKRKLEASEKKTEYLFYCLQHDKGESIGETKKRVFLNMPKADGSLREFQIASNYILRKLKEICNENGISFFLDGGTLLGAIRHHGFIPWDDDVDIGMMREDYNHLMEVLKNHDELEMHRYYRYTRPGVEAGFVTKVKIRSYDTYYVDVFPFDIMYIDPEDIELMWRETQIISDAFHRELKTLFDNCGVSTDCLYPTKNLSIDDEVEKLEKKHLDSFYSRFSNSVGTVPYSCHGVEQLRFCREMSKALPKSIFLPFISEGIFENELYPVPNDFHAYLSSLYGDYMSLPSVIVYGSHANELLNSGDTDRKLLNSILEKNEP